MSAHLTEEEQLEALKRWWNDNGKIIVAGILIALGGFWGWSQYQSHKEAQAQKNSLEFQKLATAVGEVELAANDEVKAAKQSEALAVAGDLSDEHSDTLYGDFAQFYLAKLAADKKDWDGAKVQLKKVIDEPSNAAIKELAELRYARVEAASGDVQGALNRLDKTVSEAFASLYAEAAGDIHMSIGELEQARQSYQKATDSLDENDFMRRSMLRMKLDNTSVASDVPEIAPESAAGDA